MIEILRLVKRIFNSQRIMWDDIEVGQVYLEECDTESNYCVKTSDSTFIIVDAIGENVIGIEHDNALAYDHKYLLSQEIEDRYVT